MKNRLANRVIMFLLLSAASATAFYQTSDSFGGDVRMLGGLVKPEIIIRKRLRVLDVYDGGELIRSFTVALGFAPTGDKQAEGDGKTPEGEFYVFAKNSHSKYHLSLGLSYPSTDDATRGFASGMITKTERDEIVSAIDNNKMPPQKTALGGEIYIHGGGIEKDWTWGCVALTNEAIEELFRTIPVGAKVTIKP